MSARSQFVDDALDLGVQIVSDAFWGILLLIAGALVLLRALGGGRR